LEFAQPAIDKDCFPTRRQPRPCRRSPRPVASTAVAEIKAEARDVDAIERVLDINSCDFLVTVDGSGVGRNDAMISVLARR